MSGLEFVADIVGSLAWPLVILVVLVLFRRQVAELVGVGLKRLKVGPIEAEWDIQVSRVEVGLEAEGIAEPQPAMARGDLIDGLEEIADTSPVGAVVEASKIIEEELRKKLVSNGVEYGERLGMAGLAKLAARHELVSGETLESLEGLSAMRNLAVHRQRPVTTEQAKDFLALARAVMWLLQRPAA